MPWVSDGRQVSTKAIRRVYRDPQPPGQRGVLPFSLTQAVKHRKGGRIVGVEVRTVLGEPGACPYGVHQERLKGCCAIG